MKSKINLSFLIFFIFNLLQTHAQSLNWQWGEATGSVGNDFAKSIATDVNGNVYTTGYFEGTVDFNPGADTFNLTSTGGQDIFILKFDGTGNFEWAIAIGGIYNDYGNSITSDDSGNLYTTGYYSDTVDFDPDTATNYYLTANGLKDVFIIKLNNTGHFIWAASVGGPGNDAGQAITLDPNANGDLYTTGSFQDTVDFDPGSGVVKLPGGPYVSIFNLKLDSSGHFILAKTMKGITGDAYVSSIAVDMAGSMYTTGYFQDSVNFDPNSTGAADLISISSSPDIFISKLDNLGNFVWVKQIGSIYFDKSFSIVLDPSSSHDIFLTGYFRGTVDFDAGPSTYNLNSNAGYNNLFILKLDSLGDFSWAKPIGGANFSSGYGLSTDKSGNGAVYVTGFFNGTTDFDPDTGISYITSAGLSDGFITKFSNSGNFIWAKQLGGADLDIGNGISVTSDDNVHITGSFRSTSIVLTGLPTLINSDTSGVTWDIFVAKLSCSTISTLSATACFSYVSPSGQYTWNTSGSYNDTIPNSTGCDSIININLAITTFTDSITQNGVTLSVVDSGMHYQWLDCDNGFSPLPGDTNRLFTASVDGHYAVAIMLNGCTDTSACYTITGVGINEINSQSNFDIFPNPARDQFTIALNSYLKAAEVTIRDITGKEIYAITVSGKRSIEIDRKDFAEGIYAVEVKRDDFIETKKLIITK